MELAMTKEQYELMMKEIEENHNFGKSFSDKPNSKHIKYVRPCWDLRDGMCFSVRFDGLCCDMNGKTFGSGYAETEPMFDRIMAWLESTPPAILHGNGGRA